MSFEFVAVCPKGYEPDPATLAYAQVRKCVAYLWLLVQWPGTVFRSVCHIARVIPDLAERWGIQGHSLTRPTYSGEGG